MILLKNNSDAADGLEVIEIKSISISGERHRKSSHNKYNVLMRETGVTRERNNSIFMHYSLKLNKRNIE